MTTVTIDRALLEEVVGFLESTSVGAMSRNNAENLALEMLKPLREALQAKPIPSNPGELELQAKPVEFTQFANGENVRNDYPV